MDLFLYSPLLGLKMLLEHSLLSSDKVEPEYITDKALESSMGCTTGEVCVLVHHFHDK